MSSLTSSSTYSPCLSLLPYSARAGQNVDVGWVRPAVQGSLVLTSIAPEDPLVRASPGVEWPLALLSVMNHALISVDDTPIPLTNAAISPWVGRPLGSDPSYARLSIPASLLVGKGCGLSLLVACCIWNSVDVELAMAEIASMHAFPQTMVQPGLRHSWQSRLDLVLHISGSGLGGAGQGTLQFDVVVIGGANHLSPAAPFGSLAAGSLRMQIPSFRGKVLGRTSSLYLSSLRAEITPRCCWVNG